MDFSELEQKVYKGCAGSEFYTKLGIEIDTKGTIVTHCGLDLLEGLPIKVPFACVMGQKLFVVHLMFDCRGKWTFTLATSDVSENMCLHNFDSIIAYFGIIVWWKIHQTNSF